MKQTVKILLLNSTYMSILNKYYSTKKKEAMELMFLKKEKLKAYILFCGSTK